MLEKLDQPLPDEIVLKIIQLAVDQPCGYSKFHFITDVLFKTSFRFRRLATDSSLWKGHVMVWTKPDFRELDFVIRECLNVGTTSMNILRYSWDAHLGRVTLPNQ